MRSCQKTSAAPLRSSSDSRRTLLDHLADSGAEPDTAFLELLTTTAETRAKSLLDDYATALAGLRDGGEARSTARALRTLVSVHVYEGSAYHHCDALPGLLSELADALAEEQHANGLWEHGADGNPPDTAFSIVDLNLTYHLLDEDAHEPTTELRATLERILRTAGSALATGGVHTANHRCLCRARTAGHCRRGGTADTGAVSRTARSAGSRCASSWPSAICSAAAPRKVGIGIAAEVMTTLNRG